MGVKKVSNYFILFEQTGRKMYIYIEERVQTLLPTDSPDRCQKISRTNQCIRPRLRLSDGTLSEFCEGCGGNAEQSNLDKENLSLYHLEKYKNRTDNLTTHKQSKSLANEIGILRMLLEKVLTSCKTDDEVLMRTPQMMMIMDKLTKTIPSSHKLDMSLGNTFSLYTANQLADEIIRIVDDHIEDKDIVTTIALDIGEAIERATIPKEE